MTQNDAPGAPPEAETAARTPGLNAMATLRLLRSATAGVLAQANLHARLAGVEWAQEKRRLAWMLIALLFAMTCLLCVLLLGGAVLLLTFWDSAHRWPAIIVLAVTYCFGALLAGCLLRVLSQRSAQAFVATREEIAADIAMLRSKL